MVQAGRTATRSREIINLARSCPRETSSRSRETSSRSRACTPQSPPANRHGAGGAPRAARETEMRSQPGDAISSLEMRSQPGDAISSLEMRSQPVDAISTPEMRSAPRLARPAADLGSAAGAAASADVLGGGDRLRAVLATRRLAHGQVSVRVRVRGRIRVARVRAWVRRAVIVGARLPQGSGATGLRLWHAPAPSSRAPCASSRRPPRASAYSHGSRGSPCAAEGKG